MLSLFDNKKLVCGVDEAGRGSLAGPVTAAAVILPKNYKNSLIKDSKKLNQDQRTRLYNEIKKDCISYSIMSIDSKKIDKINILNSTYLAMNFAIENLDVKPYKIIIDGNRFKTNKKINFECIVGGDDKYLSIAAASILAKVKRDEIMYELHTLFPIYDWKNNKGYGTINHREMISKHGLCRFHRKTFKIKYKLLKLTI
ncbi:MAG: ribonuclease HII [Cryomorphaceae bacterium]|nr:MAG: ribonuclease HII [Cryomorphaceae bacterium]|tara:strand:- start:49 stop:645 length:597 start_codon:yes stop_codon:yes gene_type:complete